jgi:DNA repair protein RecO (recombination protein O)
MEWRDISIVLSVKSFSENSRVVTVFNSTVGKISGLVRSVKNSIQVGDISDVIWRGRTAEHLGLFTVENIFSSLQYIFNNPDKIFAIESACTLCINCMPDRVTHPKLFESMKSLLLSAAKSQFNKWIADYVWFEMSLLSEIGMGLDLEKCAVTGRTEGLCYVSPKTGCAVTSEAAGQYKERLFPLPKFMITKDESYTKEDIFYALDITGHFLNMYFYGINGRALPMSRAYMLNAIHEQAL